MIGLRKNAEHVYFVVIFFYVWRFSLLHETLQYGFNTEMMSRITSAQMNSY